MKTSKKPAGKAKVKEAEGAKKVGVKPLAAKPVKKFDDEDDDFDEPIDEVDFDSLKNYEEEEDY